MPLSLQPTTISSVPISGLLNYDILTQVIYYSDVAAVGNFQINFRGNSVTTFASTVPVGNTLDTVLFFQMGATPYSLTSVTVDGITPVLFLTKPLPITWGPNQIVKLSISITQSAPSVFLVY